MADGPKADRAVLSREYSELLVELSIALHKFSMYPEGHPALGPATEAVVARAVQLFARHPQVAFGVARRQLIIEGIATNQAQPVLRRLAEGLHRHQLGAVTLLRGLEASEVAAALRALAREPEQGGPLGLTATVAQLTWPHLRLHPLAFDGLTLASDAPVTGTAGAGGGLRGAELWIGLARAAMSSYAAAPASADAVAPADPTAAAVPADLTSEKGERERADDIGSDAAHLEPAVVAHAIDTRSGTVAYDQVIVGYLLQIARELRGGQGADMVALRRRTAQLVSSLSPTTLRRLVEMGGDVGQRRAFVLDASQGMAVDAVIEIVKAAADASGQTISHGLVRMLSKLAAHAEHGDSRTRPLADAALREQVGQLLSGWQLADPNPAGYTAVLQQVAINPVAVAPASATGSQLAMEPLDPLRVIQMGLEIGEPGPLVERAAAALLREGRAGDLLTAIDNAPAQSAAVIARLQTQAVGGESLRHLLLGVDANLDALDRLQPHLTADSYAALLDILVTSENRAVRRRLLDRLAQAPIDLGPLIAARLADARWFVQRNMLVLLERIGRVPDGLSLAPWVSHADVRVRHEAIRLSLRLPGERDAAVRAALHDGHPRLVHQGLVAVQQECPPGVVELVGAIALSTSSSEDSRVLAVRALGRCPDHRAVEPLLRLATHGRTVLGRARLAPRSPLMLAALTSLAGKWRNDPRALAVVRLAAHSSDVDVQRAVSDPPSPVPPTRLT